MAVFADLGPIDYFARANAWWRAVGWFGRGHPVPHEDVSAGRADLLGGNLVRMGISNLWVPGDRCLYVAPSLIAHYIQEHGYRPPDEFVDAVLRCPDFKSAEYRDAMCAADPDFARNWPST